MEFFLVSITDNISHRLYLLATLHFRENSRSFKLFFKIYECFALISQDGVCTLSDKEIQKLVESKTIPGHQLEKVLNNPSRAVKIR